MNLLKTSLIIFMAGSAFLVNSIVAEANVSQLPDFASYKDVKAKKKAFFDFMRPIVVAENAKVTKQRQRLLSLQSSSQHGAHISPKDATWIKSLASHYKVKMKSIDDSKTWATLVTRVDIVPNKLALAQAANESAWGTSRFAKQGLNLFGMWCFSKGCGIVPKRRTAGMTHEVAVFPSINDSVAAYIRNINTLGTYAMLRKVRSDMRAQGKEPTGHALAEGLVKYSERGTVYVHALQSMMRTNSVLMMGQ